MQFEFKLSTCQSPDGSIIIQAQPTEMVCQNGVLHTNCMYNKYKHHLELTCILSKATQTGIELNNVH